jgi:formylmethanofuran dehydrogenase subunit E
MEEAAGPNPVQWGFESLVGHMEDEDEYEKCSRCGDPITDTNVSDKVSDDLCRDCRFEEDNP